MRRSKKRKLKLWFKVLTVILGVLIVFVSTLVVHSHFLKQENKKAVSKNKEAEKAPEIVIPEETESRLSLIMVGDALIHKSIYLDAEQKDGTYDFKKMFVRVKPIIEKYDLAFYNQETILGGKELGLSTYPTFNSPYEVGDAFLDAGFNLVSLANNHTLDRGKKAVVNSRNYWNEKDVMVTGSATSQEERDEVLIREKNGIKYSLLAYTTLTNGIPNPTGYHVNVYSDAAVKRDIERVKDKVDYIFVSMHWGIEYHTGVSAEQKRIARYLSDLGVDIVIGHHPHVVEPLEYINDTLVIYSLGNFISSQNGSEKRSGVMVAVDIILDEDTKRFENLEAILIYTYYRERSPRDKYMVYPYSELDNSILPNYQNQFRILSERLKSLENEIVVR